MKKLGVCIGVIGFTVVLYAAFSHAGVVAGKAIVHSDPLTGYQEATPAAVSSVATGSFLASIDDNARTIDYTLSYTGLEATATVAHIHFGNRSTNGGVAVFLCGGGGRPACPTPSGTVTGTITAADVVGPVGQGIAPGELDELISAIRAGVAYANVHSSKFPMGEIRGQINNDNQRQP